MAADTDLEQQVAEAFKDVREGKGTATFAALRAEGASLLPVLRPYLTDADVRLSAASLIGDIPGAESARVLAPLVADADYRVARRVVKQLFANFTCSDLEHGGGVELRDNFVQFFIRDMNASVYPPAESLRMLGCFHGDDSSAGTLRELAARRPGAKVQIEPWGKTIDMTMAVDMVLAELGDEAARDRTVEYIRTANMNVLVFMLSGIRFIENKTILRATAELLKDKRDAVPVAYDLVPPTYLRMCDFAARGLVAKTGIAVGIDPKAKTQLSDDDLSRAYEEVKRVLE